MNLHRPENESLAGRDLENIKLALKRQEIETPSWAYGNAGTRFKVFPWPGAARDVFEKLVDAPAVHQLTGITPRVALHIPWDRLADWGGLQASGYRVKIAHERGLAGSDSSGYPGAWPHA
jgi:L-rhamnose isomerase/sugar isomerase